MARLTSKLECAYKEKWLYWTVTMMKMIIVTDWLIVTAASEIPL